MNENAGREACFLMPLPLILYLKPIVVNPINNTK